MARTFPADKMAKWAKEVTRLRKLKRTDDQIIEEMKLDRSPAKLSDIDDHIASWANVFRLMGQGVTFGFGDEITAGIRALGGEDYDKAVAEERADIEQYEQAFPAKALGLEVAGAAPTMLIPGLGQARAATTLGRLGKAALHGAAEGGITGVGKGEDTLANRVQSGIGGSVGGAAGGTLMRGGVEALGPAMKRGLARALGTSADEQAAKKVIQDAAALDEGPEAILQRAGQVTGSRQGDVVLGDLGENLRSTTQAVANLPSRAMPVVRKAMKDRESRLHKRLMESVRRGLNSKKPLGQSMADEIIDISKAQKGLSDPAYRSAFEGMDVSGMQVQLWLGEFAKDSLIKKAAKEAKFFVELGEKFDLNKATDPRTWDLVKQGLDRFYEKSLNKKTGLPTKISGQILKRKNQLLDILDSDVVDPSGAYKTARLTFAEPAQIKSAMNKGYELFRMVDETKIGFALHDVTKMGTAEKDALVRGVAYSIRNLIKEGGDKPTTIKRLFKGDRLRTLKEAFSSDEAFERFRREMDDEIMMFDTSATMLRGSRTEPLKRSIDALIKQSGMPSGISREGIISGIIGRIRSEGAEATKDRVLKHVGDMLLSSGTDPTSISKILTGTKMDHLYDGVRAVMAAMAEKTGRRVGEKGLGDFAGPLVVDIYNTVTGAPDAPPRN